MRLAHVARLTPLYLSFNAACLDTLINLLYYKCKLLALKVLLAVNFMRRCLIVLS